MAPAQDRLGLDDDQAVAPLRPPPREQDPKQPIPETKARATGSAALEHGDLMAQRDRFLQQRGAGRGFAASGATGSASLVGIPMNAGYRQTFETSNEFAPIKF